MIRNIRFFAEMRIDNIDLTGLRINETVPSLLIPVNAVEARAKIVITDVGVDKGTFPRDASTEERRWQRGMKSSRRNDRARLDITRILEGSFIMLSQFHSLVRVNGSDLVNSTR